MARLIDWLRLYLRWRRAPETLQPLNLYPIWEPDSRFWRSAQPMEADLLWIVPRLEIASVLILRSRIEPWEATMLAQLGVSAHHVPLSASREPQPDQVLSLLSVLRAATRPLLLHCRAGADRAGVASFLARFEILRLAADEALAALDVRYFHLPEIDSRTAVLRRWAEEYARRRPAATGDDWARPEG